jgi:hypothetical protein
MPVPKRRRPGRGAGKWTMAGDFNAPLPAAVLEAFLGGRV